MYLFNRVAVYRVKNVDLRSELENFERNLLGRSTLKVEGSGFQEFWNSITENFTGLKGKSGSIVSICFGISCDSFSISL
jgi:hypothetical protein